MLQFNFLYFSNLGNLLPISVSTVDSHNNITNIYWEKIGGNTFDFDRGMDGSITILDVQKRHEGEYKCTLTTQYDSASTTVTVGVEANAPVIVKHSQNQTIFSGDGLLLMCYAEGLPSPKISWKLNLTEVVPPVFGREFEISHAIHSDTGRYTCKAQNEYGETKRDIFIAVITLPIFKNEIIIYLGINEERFRYKAFIF